MNLFYISEMITDTWETIRHPTDICQTLFFLYKVPYHSGEEG